MDIERPPSLEDAVSGDKLIDELGKNCPLQIDLAGIYPLDGRQIDSDLPKQTVDALRDASIALDLWKLPVDLPPPRRNKWQPQCRVNLKPLYSFYAEHEDTIGHIRWAYDLYYLEVLAKEGRVIPSFWSAPGRLPEIMAAYRQWYFWRPQFDIPHKDQLWEETWSHYRQTEAILQSEPTDWLELLVFDETIASDHVFVPESIRLSHVPVYVGVSAEDIRQCMVEDLQQVLIMLLEGPDDAVERWEEFAVRLGIRARWPSQEAFLTERRDAYVLNRLREGMTVREVARRLVDLGLYRVRKRDSDEIDFENVRRTVYTIRSRLIQQGRLREDDVQQ